MADRDEELLEQATRGDRSALTSLLKRFGPEIRREIASRIPKPLQASLDAHDVMQVTYLEVFLHILDFRPGGAVLFKAWLRRLALNNLRDAIRGIEADKRPDPRKRVQPAPHDEDATSAGIGLLGVTDTTPSVCARLGEARDLLAAAVERLPSDYRTVVRMCDLEGKSVTEAAEALGRSTGAIHMLRARARELLRRDLPSESKILESRF